MTTEEQIYQDLHNKYNKQTIKKEELAQEMGIGLSTLSKYLASGIGIPNYKRVGDSKNARVLFNLRDVSEFLSQTIKTI